MIEPLVQIHQCTPADLQHLEECAKLDGHAVIAPSYVVLKGEQTVGYIGVLPTVTAWLDTQRVQVRDSLVVQNFWENQLRANFPNMPVIGVACTQESPFFKYLPRVGYVDSKANVFLKNIAR